MKKILLVLLFLFPVYLFAQECPANLEECYEMLDSIFSEEDIQKIAASDDIGVMVEYHHSIGMYVRNEWIRHGNPSLAEQINYKPWRIGIDDVGGVILDGYWHYLHGEDYDWSGILDAAEKYYRSCEVPSSFPKGVRLKNQNVMYGVDHDGFTEMIHVYREKKSGGMYYLFSHSRGWIKMDSNEFADFDAFKEVRESYFK